VKLAHVLVGLSALLGIKRAVTLSQGGGARQELRYHVPNGQDAAAVLAAVREQGLSATIAIDGGYEDVVIACDPERQRERVRGILRNAPVGLAGKAVEGPPIVFADEDPMAK